MFFKLNLIQSYGSGIRRAKTALSHIGSPALVFEPDNDMDDYTAVTAYINEEFAQVKAEEEGHHQVSQVTDTVTKTKNGTENDTENDTERLPEGAYAFLMSYSNKKRMTAEGIMAAIVSDGTITIPRMAEITGASERTVKRYLKEFQEGNVLKREGSDTSGRWILS